MELKLQLKNTKFNLCLLVINTKIYFSDFYKLEFYTD